MSASKGRLVLAEDDAAMRDLLARGLERRGFTVKACATVSDARALLSDVEPDVVLTDLNLPGASGLDLARAVDEVLPGVPVVVLTAFGSLESAVGAIRAGAYDFVTKPIELDALELVLERAVEHRRLTSELKRLRETVNDARLGPFGLGESPAFRAAQELLARVAGTDSTVLVTGESGTGKELAARALHASSRRAKGPFVAVNCAAMPEALLESELFGHVKGAFTDAHASKTGLFQEANGGTLFLDEVGELPLSLQPKLLRALQERLARPVGGSQELAFDVRVVAATNRDLEAAVERGRFREDLFYRLNVIGLELPPLRLRGNDVLLLAHHFVGLFAKKAQKHVTGLSAPAAQKLLAYPWPGNVRELSNCIERAVALTRFAELTVDDLPEKVQRFQSTQVLPDGADAEALVPLEEVEKRYILRVLAAVGNSRTLAAKTLGLDRKTLYRKLERWGEGGGDDK